MKWFLAKGTIALFMVVKLSVAICYSMQVGFAQDDAFEPEITRTDLLNDRSHRYNRFILEPGFCSSMQNFWDHLQAIRNACLETTFLDLGETEVNDEQLNHILRICGKNLIVLNLYGCPNVCTFDFANLTPNLEYLFVSSKISDQIIDSLRWGFPKIKKIVVP